MVFEEVSVGLGFCFGAIRMTMNELAWKVGLSFARWKTDVHV
jgi:hypothetical protein